jgi:outer membrane cobalamin receptor
MAGSGREPAGPRGGLRAAAWLAGLALAPVAAAADEAPTTTSEVVVTASHFAHAADRATADTTVLAPDAAPAGATLGEALASLSDIEVQRPGGAAGVASIFVRGAKPNFTLVMVEGVPLNDQTNSRGGSTDVSAINLLDVEQVEVVRGALSSVYGSGAIEGAVNLILPGGAVRPTAVAAVEGGSARDASVAVVARAPLAGGAGGSLGLDWADAGHAVEQSSRVNAAIDAKIAPLDGSDRYGVVVRLSRSDSDAFPDDSGGPRLAVLRAVERTRAQQALIGAHWRLAMGRSLSLELNGAGTTSRFDDRSPGVAPGPSEPTGVPAGATRDRYGFAREQAILRLDSGGDWRALAGTEAQEEDGRTEGVLRLFGHSYPSRYALGRTTWAAFAEADGEHGPLSLDSSLRVDQPQGLGDHLTGRVGVAWRLARSLSLHAAWGESFKAPSFYALGDAFVGNPSLRPETATAAEVGLTWTSALGPKLAVILLRTQYHQLIDFVAGPPPRLENRSSVLSQGVQASVSAPIAGRGALSLSAAYIDTRDQTGGSRLADLPPWRASAALDWRFSSHIRARLDAVGVGDRLDTSVPTGNVILPPYASVNARLFLDVGHRGQIEASVENALDKHYEAAVGFPAPGVTGRLAFTQRF